MQAMAESRSPADTFSLALWAVTVLASIADAAGGEGLSYSAPFALLGLVAVELRSQRLTSACIKLTALSLLLDIIFLASFGASRGGAVMAFASLAFLAKLAALVAGRRYLVEDLGGVLGLVDPAPLVSAADGGDNVGGGGGGGGAGVASLPQIALDSGGGGGGGGGSFQASSSSYQSAL